MPRQCKKCDGPLPYTIRIDGKKKNLGNRKYCLTCSPWGAHNTVKLHELAAGDGLFIACSCKKCGRDFAYEKKKGHTRSQCNTCMVNRRRPVRKVAAVRYKGGACLVCGYRRCVSAMDFHHLDPTCKDFAISTAYLLAEDTLREELDKCVLLCCRCHSEVHDGLIDRHSLESLETARVARSGTGKTLFTSLLQPETPGD